MTIKDNSMIDLIGNTPLVRLKRIEEEYHLNSKIYAKLERCNPTGSIKDRAAKNMLLNALKTNRIDSETLIIEPTSGNTGIGLAAICATLNLKCIIFMPSSASKERRLMMQAFGAEVRLVDQGGMTGCIKEANLLHEQIANSFIPAQFDNKDNFFAHYETTGPEIYEQTNGEITSFVAGFGTGGTLSGISKFLKEKNPSIHTIGLEPASSPFVSKKLAGAHKIQGIGAGFKPSILDLEFVDEVQTVTNEDAYQMTRLLASREGLLVGISSGCNVVGCVRYASEKNSEIIVTVLPDNGERYLSVEGLYD